MPCISAASTEPPQKAQSQASFARVVRKRNSKATPRSTSASSIAISGA